MPKSYQSVNYFVYCNAKVALLIKGIEQLKKFGVFDDYSRPPDTSEFSENNIIYGWNYSGKTTVSRLFQCIENRAIPDEFANTSFSVLASNDTTISAADVEHSNEKVCVFNTDFVEQNLHWDGSDFTPILLLGDESIEAEKRIKKKSEMLLRCRSGYLEQDKKANKAESEIRDLKTKKAAAIKKELRLIEAFTATHVNQLLATVTDNPKDLVLSDEEEVDLLGKATASESEKLPVLDELSLPSDLAKRFATLESELKHKPELTNTIHYLTKNNELSAWVREGLALHLDSEQCKFCENKITLDRKTELNAHYSKDLTEHEARLKVLQSAVANSTIQFNRTFEKSFYPALQAKAKKHQDDIEETVKLYNDELKKMDDAIITKLAQPFDIVAAPSINSGLDQKLADAQNIFNKLVVENNAQTKNFDQVKADAIKRLKEHFVASFMVESELVRRNYVVAIFEQHKSSFKKIGEKLKLEIVALEAQISDAQKGREELNLYVSKFLNGLHIKIDVVKVGDQERFILTRGGQAARNLSEGEKTAIAFAFFLVKLKERSDTEELVVFLDDPVSSLDSNHLFQIYAVIQQEFFYQDPHEDFKWKLTIGQLFCSTHNFEFLGLLRKLPIDSKARRKFFFVKRLNASSSTLINLPKSIERYDSEYHYLWSVLANYHGSDDKTDLEVLLALPNAVRRFVELYTYAKIPSTQSVGQRASLVFGSEKSNRILKVLHHFSHSNDIYGISQNSDLICDIENCVNDIVDHVASDTQHYDALMQFA